MLVKEGKIQYVQVKCDLVALDRGLNESFIKLLQECKKLALKAQHLHISMSDNNESNRLLYQHLTIIHIVKSVFVSLHKTRTAALTFTRSKMWNYISSPAFQDTTNGVVEFTSDGEFEFRMQIRIKTLSIIPDQESSRSVLPTKTDTGASIIICASFCYFWS